MISVDLDMTRKPITTGRNGTYSIGVLHVGDNGPDDFPCIYIAPVSEARGIELNAGIYGLSPDDARKLAEALIKASFGERAPYK